jgi:hypothetical protein
VSAAPSTIALNLQRVQALRAERASDEALAARVIKVKRFQHQRFERDYVTLLGSPRYRAAARFFLDDLYGPADFSTRDAQFGQIVPALRRLLPEGLFRTVERVVELHALSEDLDQAMARRVDAGPIDDIGYARAWRLVGRSADRWLQLELTCEVGRALDRYTRTRFLANTLKLMQGPARAVGLADLQAFLQAGVAAFRGMQGADDFLQTIVDNEGRRLTALFAGTG